MAGATNGQSMPDGAPQITGWRQTFVSLHENRDFSVLFAGNVMFFFGMNTMIILRSWLVIQKWDNVALLGYLMATVALPMLLLAPIGGVIADRVDRRKLVLVAQSFLVVTNTVVAVLIITDSIEYWHLLIVSPLTAASFALNMPARQAMVAMLVPRDKLLNAMALSTAAMNGSRILGPPLAGLFIVTMGLGPAYVVSTVFYVIAAIMMAGLPALKTEREGDFTFFQDFVEGITYMRKTPLVLGLLLFSTVPMVFAMPYQVLLPVFADRVWEVGSIGFGVIQGVGGVGGLLGALYVANLDSYPKKGRVLLVGALGFGAALILFAITPWFYVALFFMTIVGFGSMVVMTVNNTAIQLIIPDQVRGRVASVMMMSFGLMPLGAVPAGIAAERIGAPIVVAIGGTAFLIAVVAIFALLPAFRTIDRDLEENRMQEAARRSSEGLSPKSGGGRPPGAVPAVGPG